MNLMKAVIVDLDGVLWEGSCHAGLSSIVVRHEMIELLSSLSKKGIIIAALSANHSHIAEGILTALDIMNILSDWRFSFDSKEMGMQSLLNNINILPSSVVYIDDTLYERELIKKYFPDILTLDVDPGLTFLRTLNRKIKLKSRCQMNRVKYYREERCRKKNELSFSSAPEEFLKDLKTVLKVTWNVRRISSLNRIEEMFSRNHQFNSSTIKYNMKQLHQMILSKSYTITMVQAEDRYGSYGICGCIIFKNELSFNTVVITDLTFSCRVQRPHIIDSVIKYIIAYKKKQGGSNICINFYPTEHNYHLAQIFNRLGLINKKLDSTLLLYEADIKDLNLNIPFYVNVIEESESVLEDIGRIPFIYNEVQEFFSSRSTKGTLLDIGSGSLDSLGKKWYTDLIKSKTIKVIKIDKDENTKADIITDATDLSIFESNTIDIILCLEVLEHMKNFWKAIDEFLRILKEGGFLLLSAPLNFEIHGGTEDYFRFTPKGIKCIIEGAGSQEKTCKYHFIIEKIQIEGDPIYPTRTFAIATKHLKGV